MQEILKAADDSQYNVALEDNININERIIQKFFFSGDKKENQEK